MTNDPQSESGLLRAALGRGTDCPPIEELARLLGSESERPAALAKHVDACPHCQTELHLLQTFESSDVSQGEAEAVRQVTERLRARSPEILGRPAAVAAGRERWWKQWLRSPRLSPAMLAFASVLVVLAVGLQWKHNAPPALGPITSGREAMRSQALTITAPAGDLQQVPGEIQWQSAPEAVRYEVRLLEVDRTELWKAETTGTGIALPPAMQARIVPAKTILVQVSAFDRSGRRVAESEMVRFRLLQNVYGR
jgi:hypothetical protein